MMPLTYFDGYPIRGKWGESAAELTLLYEDGTSKTIPLRHGLEIASASLIGRDSRINATAVNAPPVAKLTQDHDWESYAVNLLALPTDNDKVLLTVTVQATDRAFEPVVFGISAG